MMSRRGAARWANGETALWRGVAVAATCLALAQPTLAAEDKLLLWGDTHLHTSYSIDAFLNGNLAADPHTAYRFAKGLPVSHPHHGARLQIDEPLDFLVVSDHAEFFGAMRHIYLHGIEEEDAGLWDSVLHWYTTRSLRDAIDAGEAAALFRGLLPESRDPRAAAASPGDVGDAMLPPMEAAQARAWREAAAAADAHNEPGRFTAFIGWEWSSMPGGANLHRVVMTDANATQAATFRPFSSIDSPYPDDLWRWLERTAAATGARFLAIPHNSNISKGMMFPEVTLRGAALDADHARLRMRWEKVIEVTQIKGDSEVHPALAPNDEFATFERYPFFLQRDPAADVYSPSAGDYARPALKRGLALGERLGVNPFQFGLIGSTDSHTGLATAQEDNFAGKMATDSMPESKDVVVISGGASGWVMSASGLAAVWATANTRAEILSAMQRRETYATTGPRIRLRFFGGWQGANGSAAAASSGDAAAVANGGIEDGRTPMGGELKPPVGGAKLVFEVEALKAPAGANLDRVQIVKGWLDAAGQVQEEVFDVVWAGERERSSTGKLPVVGNTVDLATGRYRNAIGAAELTASWSDPAFDAGQPAFYYARVLEIPTPRHTHLDALALGMERAERGPPTIQERAYSSPIWYAPSRVAGANE